MESDGEHTYLWGAYVRLAPGVCGLEGVEGYHSFVSWERPTSDAETRIFAEFWHWFSSLRATCDARALSFAAYCFWAQAEDGAMNRAVATPHEDGPTLEDIDAFRTQRPAQWIDLHELAASQIQTAGPLGLKVLARAAGFEWRDENPSGEASMAWFASAREGADAHEWRQRILAYNEDDCRATQALRDWLNGPARALAHRDEPGPW
jgi:predicted RecB family nuclease